MQAPAALAPAEVGVLMDMGLIKIDQQVPVALGTGEQALEPFDKGLPPLRVGPAEQLLGLLPRQLQAVQGGPNGLAAAHLAEALAHHADQALEGPARRRVGAFYGRGRRGLLGGAHDLAKAGLDLSAKGGRPPVRR